MSIEQFPFEVSAPEMNNQGTFMATVTIPIEEGAEQGRVLQYIRGIQLKNDFTNTWVRDNAPGYGLEIKGGPRPVHEVPGDRTSPVLAYQQDYRLSRHV